MCENVRQNEFSRTGEVITSRVPDCNKGKPNQNFPNFPTINAPTSSSNFNWCSLSLSSGADSLLDFVEYHAREYRTFYVSSRNKTTIPAPRPCPRLPFLTRIYCKSFRSSRNSFTAGLAQAKRIHFSWCHYSKIVPPINTLSSTFFIDRLDSHFHRVWSAR
jgi:hypothetical protein